MFEVVFFIGLVILFILSGYLFKSNLKYFKTLYGGYFLGLFFLLINTHVIFEFIFSYLNGVENPDIPSTIFFMFYGGLFYLFIKGGKMPIKESGFKQIIKLFRPILFLIICATILQLMVFFIKKNNSYLLISEFDFLIITIGLFIFFYSIKTYKLLFNMQLFSQKLRLHLLFINTFLLFAGILLIFSTFLNLKYILFYRVCFEYSILGILVYFMFIQENLKKFFTTPLYTFNQEEEIVEFDVNLDLLDLNRGFGNVEIVSKSASIDHSNDLEKEEFDDSLSNKDKYTKSKLSDLVLDDYSQKMKEVLEQEQLYLNQDFSLEDLSRESNISKQHLGQIFSIVYNTNFNRYINKLRIEYLVNYINQNLNEELTVNDLLAISSFKSRASFFRNFKEIIGVPPSTYLKDFYASRANFDDLTKTQ